MTSQYRRLAELYPNPGTQGSWRRRWIEGVFNLGTFNGQSVIRPEGIGSWPRLLWDALPVKPDRVYSGSWPVILAGSWAALIAICESDISGGAIAPILSSATATPYADPIFSGTVSTDQTGGTLYWVITTSATSPSATQVKAGQDHNGSSADLSGSSAVSVSGTQSVSGSGSLTGSTSYYAYYMHENTNGQSNIAASGLWTSYYQETIDLVARMTATTPTTTRQGYINTLIAALKTASIWSKFYTLYIMSAHDSLSARLNWISTSYNNTAVGAPTFTVDKGYRGDGSTQYLDTGFNPTTAGVGQDDVSIGCYGLDDIAVNGGHGIISGTGKLKLNCQNAAGYINTDLFQNSDFTTLTSTNVGFIQASRDGSTSSYIYKDGVLLDDSTISSTYVPDYNFYILAFNNSGTASPFDQGTVAVIFIAQSMSLSEHQALNSAIDTYLTSVGAI